MDALIEGGARRLAVGDPLGALKLVALRDDAAGLALRGIALAQLGEHPRARELLRAAARAFGARAAVARARCIVAEAEVALASRDLSWTARVLDAAGATLEDHGDHVNAAHARYVGMRRLLLVGRLDDAERALAAAPPSASLALRTGHELIAAQLATRRLRMKAARAALARARRLAGLAGIPALVAEVETALGALDTPVARRIASGRERPLRLDDVESLFASDALIVDGCRYEVRQDGRVVSLATRPVLLALVRALAEAWPGDASRDELVLRVFRLKLGDESHRARLRVEVGRLRKLLRAHAGIRATPRGFALVPRDGRDVIVLARPVDEPHADLLAVLADGEAWSTSALAETLGVSQRTLQRSLEALAGANKVYATGRGRARRWMASPAPPIPTPLLLPAVLPTA